jgi:hypothetical protein
VDGARYTGGTGARRERGLRANRWGVCAGGRREWSGTAVWSTRLAPRVRRVDPRADARIPFVAGDYVVGVRVLGLELAAPRRPGDDP